MKRDNGGQLGWTEAFMAPGLGINATLQKIDEFVKWQRFAKLLNRVRPGTSGRPPYPAMKMFKALLLQQWYGLSDPGLEEALNDRLSFRRFCGFAMDEATPDETTICRFRQALIEAGLSDRLLGELNRQLDRRGLLLKQGTMIDATLVAAQAAAPPFAKGRAARSEVDPDADWTRKGGTSHFGWCSQVVVATLYLRRQDGVFSYGRKETLGFHLGREVGAVGSLATRRIVVVDWPCVWQAIVIDSCPHISARGDPSGSASSFPVSLDAV